mmetsp:Transcript_14436/g.34567  ORF Transcript_14436/g.34567 Transcript_14436/m.34567 type:complete len:386 (-) Transcript_14436:162-1319(-)
MESAAYPLQHREEERFDGASFGERKIPAKRRSFQASEAKQQKRTKSTKSSAEKGKLKPPPPGSVASAYDNGVSNKKIQPNGDETSLVKPEGQLAKNPELSNAEAVLAAKREYNRRNAARARSRNKNLVHDLQQQVYKLAGDISSMKKKNAKLRDTMKTLTEENQKLAEQQLAAERQIAAKERHGSSSLSHFLRQQQQQQQQQQQLAHMFPPPQSASLERSVETEQQRTMNTPAASASSGSLSGAPNALVGIEMLLRRQAPLLPHAGLAMDHQHQHSIAPSLSLYGGTTHSMLPSGAPTYLSSLSAAAAATAAAAAPTTTADSSTTLLGAFRSGPQLSNTALSTSSSSTTADASADLQSQLEQLRRRRALALSGFGTGGLDPNPFV